MEVNIGVRQSNRELTVDVDITAEAVRAQVAEAIKSGDPLRLEESNGRAVLVPAEAIAYVEIAASQNRRVGFGF